MAKEASASAVQNKLDLKGQGASMNAISGKLADFKGLLALRAATYAKMGPVARKAWRENAADPVMAEYAKEIGWNEGE
jgi:hypothetical protein